MRRWPACCRSPARSRLAGDDPLWTGFDYGTAAMQFVELAPWIPRFNINYHLGADGISMLFVILNSFITVIVVLAGWQVIEQKVVAQYMAAFLIMSGLMNGIFARSTACCSTSSSKPR